MCAGGPLRESLRPSLPALGGVSFGAGPQDRTACAGCPGTASGWDGASRGGEGLTEPWAFTPRDKGPHRISTRKQEVWSPFIYYAGFSPSCQPAHLTCHQPQHILPAILRPALPLTSTPYPCPELAHVHPSESPGLQVFPGLCVTRGTGSVGAHLPAWGSACLSAVTEQEAVLGGTWPGTGAQGEGGGSAGPR